MSRSAPTTASSSAVRGMSFEVEPGQTLGIVGESGSGKSVSTQTIMGLTRGAQVDGQALFDGRDLLTMSTAELPAVRGRQDRHDLPGPAVQPAPVLQGRLADRRDDPAHDKEISKAGREKRAVELLRLVGIPQPDRRVDDYPHQFSGGMRQRAMIAMAMALNPELLIADEPTTALDVTVQAQVLQVISRLQQEFGTAVILITHDLGVIAEVADDVVVMYAGTVMEQADRVTTFKNSTTPTPRACCSRCRPTAATGSGCADPGQPPSPITVPPGCPFAPALPLRHGPVPRRGAAARAGRRRAGHLSACWLPRNSAARQALRAQAGPDAAGQRRSVRGRDDARDGRRDRRHAGSGDVLLRVDGPGQALPGAVGQLFQPSDEVVHAVDGVSLEVRRGETLGLVGETGCGKSTLARCVARLYAGHRRHDLFDGHDISGLSPRQMRPFRREMQMIFQDPYGSLNPRRRVGSIIGDPFAIHDIAERRGPQAPGPGADGAGRAQPGALQPVPGRVLRRPAAAHRRRPGAGASGPKLIVCDEPVSALDVSIQAQIINLLADLQSELGLTYIFIAHDLSVVRHVSDRVAVMYLGKIAERRRRGDVAATRGTPTPTRCCRRCRCPIPTHADQRERIILVGDVPSPIDPPSGCRFHPRCPKARQTCVDDEPELDHPAR